MKPIKELNVITGGVPQVTLFNEALEPCKTLILHPTTKLIYTGDAIYISNLSHRLKEYEIPKNNETLDYRLEDGGYYTEHSRIYFSCSNLDGELRLTGAIWCKQRIYDSIN